MLNLENVRNAVTMTPISLHYQCFSNIVWHANRLISFQKDYFEGFERTSSKTIL